MKACPRRGGVQELNKRGVLLSRPCRWLVLDYNSQQWILGILAVNKSSYATLKNSSHQIQTSGDNSAKGAEGCCG